MFDDPKKELQRLEDELLAAEEIQWQESWERELEQPPEAASAQPEELPEDELPEEEPAEKSSRAPLLIALLLIEIGLLFAALAWWLLCR